MTLILSIVLISVVLDYYQEAKAGKAAELLKEKEKSKNGAKIPPQNLLKKS